MEPRFLETSTGIPKECASARFCELSHGSAKSDMPTCGQDTIRPIQTYFQTIEYFTVQRSRFAKEYIGFAVSITKNQEERYEHQK